MSENQNRGISDFSKYDSMATEILEEILRLDAEGSISQKSDEELFYIMEVLALRKQNSDNPGKTAQEAWGSFQAYYAPQTPQKERHFTSQLRKIVAAAAIIVALVIIPLTAQAFSWKNIWSAVATWVQGTFSFVTGTNPPTNTPTPDNTQQYNDLQKILAEASMRTDIVPTWLPDGYFLEKTKLDETPFQTNCLAVYSSEGKKFTISVRSYIEGDPERIEVNDNLIELYTVSGADYYILSNNQQNLAIWIIDSYECNISGDLAIEELKIMINSIGKG